MQRTWLVDPFSTGGLFAGWKELEGSKRWTLREDYQPLTVWSPRTWLLAEGWRRYGLLRCLEVPSANAIAKRHAKAHAVGERGGMG